jgi:hypothetical protein
LEENPEKLSNPQIMAEVLSSLRGVPSTRRAQEMVSAASRALADAGRLREHSTRSGGRGGVSKVYSHPKHNLDAVEVHRNPALYLMQALHQADSRGEKAVPASQIYKQIDMGSGKVGNPDGRFDSRSIHRAARRAESEGLVRVTVDASKIGRRGITAKRFNVSLTPEGKAAWREHLITGKNKRVLKISKRRK